MLYLFNDIERDIVGETTISIQQTARFSTMFCLLKNDVEDPVYTEMGYYWNGPDYRIIKFRVAE